MISRVRVLLQCILETVLKSPGNLFCWICSHPEEASATLATFECQLKPAFLTLVIWPLADTVCLFTWMPASSVQDFLGTVCVIS